MYSEIENQVLLEYVMETPPQINAYLRGEETEFHPIDGQIFIDCLYAGIIMII